MTDTPTLFDAPAQPAARNTDPSTSHTAAASLAGPPLRHEQARVIVALADLGGRGNTGGTPHDLARWLAHGSVPPAENCVASRLSELERTGLVARDGSTRPGGSERPQRVACLTDAGRAAVDDARALVDRVRAERAAP